MKSPSVVVLSPLEQSIENKAIAVLGHLLARGLKGDAAPDVTSWHQARKYASAAMSWCQSKVELRPFKDGKPRLHSRRRGGAGHRLWTRVIELCDGHLSNV
jgi:hypothetical protein